MARALARYLVAGLTACWVLAAPAMAQAPKGALHPVPGEAAQVDAKKLLRERLARDYVDATPAGKRRLIGLLTKELDHAGTGADWFVTQLEIRNLAVATGEVELALQTVADIATRFDVDAVAMRGYIMSSALRAKLSATQAAVLARMARDVADARLTSDDFDGALQSAQLADEAARRTGDTALQTEMALLVDYCREVVSLAPKFVAAKLQLESDPQNVGANSAAGEFLVLVKREWGRGLLLLTRGANKALAEAATAELANARGPQLCAAADAWAAYAEGKRGPGRTTALGHARMLYQDSLPSLTGSDRDRCLRRIADLVNMLPPGPDLADAAAARTKLGEARWTWWQNLRITTVAARDDAGDLKSSQALIDWRPRLDSHGDVPALPDLDDNRGAGQAVRFTYRLRLLCIDEQKRESVLERAGKVLMRDPNKQIHLTGPTNQELKRLNANKLMPANLQVEFYLDGVKVSERLWKLPATRAWWLDEEIVSRKGGG